MKKTQTISLRLSRELKSILKEEAEKQGCSISCLVTAFLSQQFEHPYHGLCSLSPHTLKSQKNLFENVLQ